MWNFSQNFSHEALVIKKISERLSSTPSWNLKYLNMCKLQFLNTTHNLLTKYHMDEISSYYFLSLQW